MKKLDKLNITHGSIQPSSTSEVPLQTFILPITSLSLVRVSTPSPLDPSSLPLVRSLHLSDQTCQPLRLLLPQLASLRVGYVNSIADINLLIQASTSITSLALVETLLEDLDDASKTVVKERIVGFRLLASIYGEAGGSTLASIINGSTARKKVTLDGRKRNLAHKGLPEFL